MDTETKNLNLVLVDGNCALCHGFVRWIIKNKKGDADIRFSALQYIGLHQPDTVVLLKNGMIYFESDVLMELSNCLKIKAKIWIHVLRIFPKKIRNYFYNLLARHRYEWFGRVSENCYSDDNRIKIVWLTEPNLKKMISVQDIISQKGTSKPLKSSGRKG